MLLADPRRGRFFAALKALFPKDFEQLIGEITRRQIAGESDEAIWTAANQMLSDIVFRQRQYLTQAPHEQIIAYRMSEVSLLEAMQADNLTLCAKYGDDPTNADVISNRVWTLKVALEVATMGAAAAGRDRPAKRIVGSMTTELALAFTDGLTRAGATEEEMAVILNPASAPSAALSTQCRTVILPLRAILLMPSEQADQISAIWAQKGM